VLTKIALILGLDNDTATDADDSIEQQHGVAYSDRRTLNDFLLDNRCRNQMVTYNTTDTSTANKRGKPLF
jgi:hypothetical protein